MSARIHGAFLLVILVTVVVAGPGPGLLATFFSGAAISYYLFEPGSFEIAQKSEALRLLFFIAIGVTMALVAEWMRRRRLSLLENTAAQARESAMEALRRSEEEYRTLFETSPDGIVRVCLKGRIEQANQAFLDMAGFDREELTKVQFGQLVPLEFRNLDEAFARAHTLKQGDCRECETELVRRDGSRVPVCVIAWPIRDAQGETIGWRAFVRDIADRKRGEKALAESSRRKDHFLATLAHELRNPLAAIRSAAFVLKLETSGAITPRGADVLSIIDRQLGHLIRLVDDLLEISRITSGKIELKKTRLDLADVIRYAVETAQPSIERGGHTFTLELPPNPLLLDADAVRLSQVFSNLLSNAAKYTQQGGVITMKAEQQGEQAVVTVADNGIGIMPETLPGIFHLFERSGNGHAHAQGGLGIGLGLVENLVKGHGGTVEAQSDGVGRGSVFTVRLPLAKAQNR